MVGREGLRTSPVISPNPIPIPILVRGSSSREDLIRVDTQEEVYTVRKLVQRTDFNENYVSRILDLAALWPEMTEGIFGGVHDPSLRRAQLITNLISRSI
jgi:hypothetical protein